MNFFYYTVCFFFLFLFFFPFSVFSGVSGVLAVQKPLQFKARTINVYPHDRKAFTQGLAFLDGFIYEGTGVRGSSFLMKKELETGDIHTRIKLSDQFFGEGITILRDRVFQLTWKSQTGFVYDLKTFKRVKTFYYKTEGWGLTNDGTNLIMSDGSSKLSFLDPEKLIKLKELEVKTFDGKPVKWLNELEFVNGSIFANIWQSDKIAIISPENGLVTGWINLEGILIKSLLTYPVDVLNGIAYDHQGDRLFVTGKLWPLIFEIELVQHTRNTP